jgi:hypothetical protein
MLRALLAVIGCFALSGCWVSEHRILGPGDWAHVNLAGKFKRENANGDEEASVVLATQPNGLIVGTATDVERHKTESMAMGLVAIQGGSGRYFLAVDRLEQKDNGDTYFIAHLTDDGGLEIYWPDCDGTPDIEGMTRQTDTVAMACNFTTKEALMEAALQAERFLSVKHVIEVAPFGRLAPDDGSDENTTDAR